jgi:hypothetical protein
MTTRHLTSVAAAALLCGSLAAGIGAQAQTVDENMAAQAKLHAIPGKQLTAQGPNYQFCEVGVIVGTTPENAVVNFYNPTGLDNCTPEQFAEIAAKKEEIKTQMGALDLFLNPSRQWTWDEFAVFEAGDEQQFGSVNMVWMGVVPLQIMKKAVGAGHYNPGQIHRNNQYTYKKGDTVYLLDTADGKTLIMQSWTNFTNKGQTADNLKDLGSQFKELPAGWSFRTKVLDQDLTVAPPAPDHLAWVTQDEFNNTYQGCGYDTACSYVP